MKKVKGCRKCRNGEGKIVDALLDRGFVVKRSNKHVVMASPEFSSICITIPSTPSDRRAALNAVSQVRRLTGIDLHYLFSGYCPSQPAA